MLTIKSNINDALKKIENSGKKLETAKVEAMGAIAQAAFKEIEQKYISSETYAQNNAYKSPSDADIPKSIRSKSGTKFTTTQFFSSKKVISRSGDLLRSIKAMANFAFDKIGVFTSDDYEVRISKNKLTILASSKAAVIERKKSPIASARRIVTKAFRKSITTFKKAYKKAIGK